MSGKRPGPTKARNSPIAVAVAVAVMEMRVALMRAGGLSVYRIALGLKVRRQSVEQILRRPHVAAMVEDFRERLRTDQLLRDWASKALTDLLSECSLFRSSRIGASSPGALADRLGTTLPADPAH